MSYKVDKIMQDIHSLEAWECDEFVDEFSSSYNLVDADELLELKEQIKNMEKRMFEHPKLKRKIPIKKTNTEKR